jgi:hypothetical protein
VDTSKASLLARTPIWSYNGKQDGVVAPLSVNLFMENLDKLDGDNGVVYTHCQGNTCPAKMSTAKIDSLISAGKTHFYSLDPARSHDGWDLYYGDTLIQKWFMKQRRDTPNTGLKPRTRNSTSPGSRSWYGLTPLVGSGSTEPENGSSPELFEVNGKRLLDP